MNVIYTFTEKQIRELHQLYKGEWWTGSRTFEDTKSCVEGSQICIGIVDDDEVLIGFVRVLTDYIFKALIFDVMVSEGSRNMGLGDRLMALVEDHPELTTVKHFELYCLPELSPFYQRHGFSADVGGIKLMRKVRALQGVDLR